MFKSRTHLLALTALPLMLAAFAAPAEYTGAPWKPMTDDATVRQILVDHSALRDPFSVQFRQVEVRVAKMDGGKPDLVTWCGELNSKNAMGAYAGWSPFYVMTGLGDKPSVHVFEDESEMGSLSLKMWCKGSRLSPAD